MTSCSCSFLHLRSLIVLLSSFALLAGRCIGDVVECSPDQRSSLLHLKHGFSFPPNELVSWEPGSNCCTWEGVTCDSESGQIISLDLGDRSITGYISHSLFSLTSLQTLNLTFDYDNGHPIPQSGFEKLKDLTHLSLTNGHFVDQLPIGISHLTRLMYLNLDVSNGTCAWSYHLKLQTLVGNLSNLRELHLWCANMSSDLDWSSALSKSVPQLQVLTVTNCDLPGLLPKDIFTLKNWTALDLSSNSMLSGDLPDFPVNNGLQSLDLSYTNISGSLPGSIGNLKYLTDLDLSSCGITGGIPSSIGNLSQLVDLDLFGNSLTGGIPNSIRNLSQLTRMDLSSNNLEGQIPRSLFGLPALKSLLLFNNQLSGPLEELSDKSISLEVIELSNNYLAGQIPRSVFELPALQILDLSSNNFNGTVELDMVGKLKNLLYLDLSHNNRLLIQEVNDNYFHTFPNLSIVGLAACGLTKVPAFLRYQNQITYLDLSQNKIGGAIPKWIWNIRPIGQGLVLNFSCNQLTHLEVPINLSTRGNESSIGWVLDFHSNKLQGPIPLSICTAKSLEYIDFSNNNLSGSIPQCLSTRSLQTLDFSNNNLSGSIPRNLFASSLQVLDLSDNNLSGSIPRYLFEGSSGLYILNLRGNRLQGIIPQHINKGCNLEILVLSDNHLEGQLPRSLVNCSSLKVLDIGNNHIIDTFPFWLGSFVNLTVLILQSNALYGPVKSMNSHEDNKIFPRLQILDLSSNHLDGDLPSKYFNNLKLMKSSSARDRRDDSLPYRYDYFNLNIKYGYILPYRYDYEVLPFINREQTISLVRISKISYTYVDFSNNHFEGDIPMVIGELQGLYMLNLSHNALTGRIPSAIGNMTQLLSLDLSANHLSGEIPQELTSLTFLSSLNLSTNNLSGEIPQSGQFSTFSNTSFDGNPGLCGIPLVKQCKKAAPRIADSVLPSKSDSSWLVYVVCLALFTGLGFGVGMAVVIVLLNVPLKFCKRGNDVIA